MSICTCTPKQKERGEPSLYCDAHMGFKEKKPRKKKCTHKHFMDSVDVAQRPIRTCSNCGTRLPITGPGVLPWPVHKKS